MGGRFEGRTCHTCTVIITAVVVLGRIQSAENPSARRRCAREKLFLAGVLSHVSILARPPSSSQDCLGGFTKGSEQDGEGGPGRRSRLLRSSFIELGREKSSPPFTRQIAKRPERQLTVAARKAEIREETERSVRAMELVASRSSSPSSARCIATGAYLCMSAADDVETRRIAGDQRGERTGMRFGRSGTEGV